MTSFSIRLLPVASFVLIVAASLSAIDLARAEPAIVAKARAFVGPEAALNSVKSVHFVGSLTTADSADPAKAARATIEIFFQAPDRQRIQATSDNSVEVTALDGYEAWSRVQDAKDPTKWRLSLLGADEIRRLRANTWESLAFYRGIEAHGGRIEDLGTVQAEGLTCAKLAFIYDHNIVFYRYLDMATGRLVYTENESGSTQREQGSLVVNGVRFPKSIVTTNKKPDGRVQSVTLTFDKVTVNEALPASLFAVPSPTVK
jgi:outer membrane lipoprotein-sorting protein